jgi:hypothetical protein
VVNRAVASVASLRGRCCIPLYGRRPLLRCSALHTEGEPILEVMTNRSRLISAVAFAAAVSLAVPPAQALADQGRGGGQPAKPAKAKADKPDKPQGANKPGKPVAKADKAADKADKKPGPNKPAVIVIDRDNHHRVIREYARAGSLPPGLAKRRVLPPGLRKQLRERGALPPGLRQYLIPVDGPFVVNLPAIPPHYIRYFAGDDLIIVDTRTNLIVAIIRDVWG